MTSLSIVFAGTPEFALPCLEGLHQSNHTLSAVYTQPDRPAGRGRQLQPSAVKQWALKQDIPVYQPVNFKSSEDVETLASLKPDVMVVIAYGLILPRRVLSIPRLGAVNVHASLLPRWRGASPIQHAVLFGDSVSGVTIMQMDPGMDTGPSLLDIPYTLSPRETAGSLHDNLAQLAAGPLVDVLDALAEGRAKATAQDESQATYAAKINKEDAYVQWQESADLIDRKIRAFNPWPIAYTKANDEVIRIHQALPISLPRAATPGTVLSIDKKGVLVATGEGALCIERFQFPGGKVISVSDWLNAKRSNIAVGMVFQ